ncbi:Dehydrogenase/reductase SDR family member on chromosome X, partial [Lacticaseibacillus paracasei subsp. paracasei Lpp48]
MAVVVETEVVAYAGTDTTLDAKNMPDLHGSYAVVTGGTSGVGFAMSAALCG